MQAALTLHQPAGFAQRPNFKPFFSQTQAIAQEMNLDLAEAPPMIHDPAVLYLKLNNLPTVYSAYGLMAVHRLITSFFNHAAEKVREYGGDVMVMQSDCLEAVFPSFPSDKALEATQDIMTALDSGESEDSLAWKELNPRAGLVVGMAIEGMIGDQQRMAYHHWGPARDEAVMAAERAHELDELFLINRQLYFQLERQRPVMPRGRLLSPWGNKVDLMSVAISRTAGKEKIGRKGFVILPS